MFEYLFLACSGGRGAAGSSGGGGRSRGIGRQGRGNGRGKRAGEHSGIGGPPYHEGGELLTQPHSHHRPIKSNTGLEGPGGRGHGLHQGRAAVPVDVFPEHGLPAQQSGVGLGSIGVVVGVGADLNDVPVVPPFAANRILLLGSNSVKLCKSHRQRLKAKQQRDAMLTILCGSKTILTCL